jgi:cytochrome c biogenesis protein
VTEKDPKQSVDPQKSPTADKGQSPFSKLYDFFASVKLAIFLLIILAVTSIIGTVVLQKGDPQQYLMEYGPGFYKFLTFLGLDDMYSSWWFLTILSLLLVNIILCSIKRFPRAWKMMNQVQDVLDEAQFKRTRHRGSVKRNVDPETAVEKAREIMSSSFGKVSENRADGAVTLYVNKGGYSRMGAYIVHLSILILAVGAVYGGIVGFKGFVPIIEGQTIDQVRLRNRDNAAIKLPFAIRCDDFRVEYYPGSMQPKDYYSDLTVFRNGKVELEKRIEVNHPLIIDGIYFYQSSYGVDPSSTVTLEVLDPAGNVAGPDMVVAAGQRFTAMGDPSTYVVEELIPNIAAGKPGVKVSQYMGSGRRDFYLLEMDPNRDKARGGQVYFTIKNTNIREYTGLQVAWDPGVPIVWLACTVMMIGLYIGFFIAHQRVWIRVDEDPDSSAVLMAGSSSRNPATFERQFDQALEELKDALRGKDK